MTRECYFLLRECDRLQAEGKIEQAHSLRILYAKLTIRQMEEILERGEKRRRAEEASRIMKEG